MIQRCCGLVLIVVALIGGTTGCTKRCYRQQADNETYGLVAEKSFDPRWALPGFNIEMDPRSRYFDPYDPDHSPMPEDDPAAHQYMHWVDNMHGWPHWHRDGDRPELANPGWQINLAQYAPFNEKSELELSVDTALRVAYVNSPDYQSQRETLYLSALDVSTERFRFSTQFYGGYDTAYRHRGRLTPGGELNQLSVGRGAASIAGGGVNALELTRRFSTAGELLVGFANSFVWEFTSGDTNFATSIASFTLVQPLLRNGGQVVALERLTIVERGLLANLRAFQRYREGFYTRVAIGELGVNALQRRGGFLGGTGLTGFSGTGAGGLGGVGAATGFGFRGVGAAGGGGGSGAGFAGGGAGTVGGYIGLLQQLQQIRNTQDTLVLQVRTLSMLEDYLNAGVIDLTQVDQFRQNIETERATLLQQENDLLTSLDTFKTGTLGLPPDTPIALDDTLIRQFQFVDPRATALQARIDGFQREVGALPETATAQSLQELLSRLTPLCAEIEQRFTDIDGDVAHMEQQAPLRERPMTEEERRVFRTERGLLRDTLSEARKRLQSAIPQLDKMRAQLQTAGNEKQTTSELVVWLDDARKLAAETILIQARARLESVVVEPIELRPEEAFQIALANRLDIMNSRASLVDSWRLIAYNANALRSNWDFVADGNMTTTRDNMLSLRAPASTVRVGMQFDPPFTRLLERNNYRQSLIDYQGDRRTFIQFMDSVHTSLRALLRNLEQLRVNLEIQRRAVAISIRRVDLTQEDLNKPVPPPEPGQPATQLGPTAALNLLTALSDLRNTQNNFMSVWLNYYASRMRLARDLGIMMLDEEGRWIDVPIPSAAEGTEELPAPPEISAEWIQMVEGLPAPEPAVTVAPVSFSSEELENAGRF